MVEQIFEFIGNHYILVGVFVLLLAAFIINERRQGGASVTPSSLVNLINRESAVVVDIREIKEYNAGHIAGAISMPFTGIDARVGELESSKDKPIVLVCRMGQHAGAVGRKLRAKGFEDIRRLSGGMAEWSASNLPVVR